MERQLKYKTMPTLADQQKKYMSLWERYFPLFGTEIFQDDPIPLYNIGISLPASLQNEMDDLSEKLQKITNAIGGWIPSSRLHITLDIPGRIDTHFSEPDIDRMQEWLREICANTQPFKVQLGNLNCFPNVLYREIYDPEEKLYALHQKIAKVIPWSEQPQFRGSSFTPHMSLMYVKQKNIDLLREDFDRSLPPTDLFVTHIYFQISTDTNDAVITRIELGTGKLLNA